MSWGIAYLDILDRLEGVKSNARTTLCGLSACVDATISLHDATAVLEAGGSYEALQFCETLLERARAGIGGELRVNWPDGPLWLDRRLAFKLDLGGTAAHAARMLAVLGVPALLALARRSPEQLSVLDPDIRIAQDGQAVSAHSVKPSYPNATKIYIFEYTKDRTLGTFSPPRSSRIIVRFDDPGIENDCEFVELSYRLAPDAGAALLSGFSAVGAGELSKTLASARELASHWLAAGLSAIHLELAGFDRLEYRDQVLGELTGFVTSLGLSLSEFNALAPGGEITRDMCALGERLGLRRVCVHADDWVATATLDDAERERDALLMGSLLASTRAEQGQPIVPKGIPLGTIFRQPPSMPESVGPWNIVACATPYLGRPAATVGLGDTFTAGCLLVLGQRRNEAASKALYVS